MIGIGTDIVEIERVEAVLDRHADRFSARILCDAELRRFRASTQPARYLAKRFAAKEAVAKAFGTGIGEALGWRDMNIDNEPSGAPVVRLSERAAALLRERGGRQILLSLADERAYAVAFALVLQ
ncbi:MAG: holo-ACP synthase [Halieaceae bacterium]|nr:holo-ACP synthase [Halieaceae bacterium]